MLNELCQAVIEGNVSLVEQLSRKVLDKGVDPLTVVEKELIEGLKVVGEKLSIAGTAIIGTVDEREVKEVEGICL